MKRVLLDALVLLVCMVFFCFAALSVGGAVYKAGKHAGRVECAKGQNQ